MGTADIDGRKMDFALVKSKGGRNNQGGGINNDGGLVTLTTECLPSPLVSRTASDNTPSESLFRFIIKDTGLGIPASDQPHIFEKFYRVRGEHVVNIKGTGLGLAIVHQIMSQHQARIEVASEPDQGTRISLSFPVKSTEVADG